MTTPATASAPPTATTRTCIKNVHPSFDEAKLKSHLQSAQPSLQITDCKLLKTKDGRSRRIAFVGFQSASQAETAVSYFDKSYAGTARLSVSLAFSKKKGPSGDNAEGYRPWSKHSVGSSRYARLQEEKEEDKISQDDNIEKEEESSKDAKSSEAERKREEFLSAMGLSSKHGGKDGKVSKKQFWGNDDTIAEPAAGAGADSTTKANPDNKNGPDDDDDGSSDSDDASSSSSNSDGEDDAPNEEVKEKDGKSTSDLDFLKSKQVKADILTDDDDDSSSDSDDSSSDGSDSSNEDEDMADELKGEQDNTPQALDVPESSGNVGEENKEASYPQPSITTLNDRLFVRNLPFTTTEEEIHERFAEFGHVTTVHIPVDDSKRNKGYAFITFESTKDAKLAMESMDGEDFQGRLIHILPAKPSTDKEIDESDMTHKERQALARQREAEKSTKGWSASFLRGDAVVDNLSNRLGVAKGDILNVKDGISSGNAAVRLALGETHIISENIAFFEEHGVDVTALESKSKKNGKGPKRSKTMILVKNLPGDTSLEDLTKTFHAIGGEVPQKLFLPPSKTAALVEYGHATDARRAFRRLAYKKFKHVPLYLEWAPMQEGGKRKPNEDVMKDVKKQESSGAVVKQGLADEDPSTETADTGVSQTIYVKNLNFSTSEDLLSKAFSKAGFRPRAVKIPTKAAALKKNSAPTNVDKRAKQMSMGFGFVEFPSEVEALAAMKGLHGKIVDGHALEIKLSTKSLSSTNAPPIDKSSKNTKIMVRNVPFEATRTELLQLFGSFGQLKKVRLPKKFDGSHRGFAFCEFVTSKEAQNAMETLSRTHLYGRHLVLEWASAEPDDGKTDIVAVREKAKRDAMSAGLGGPAKRGKHLKF